MAAANATIAGIAGRMFRISFSGELAYEVAVPARMRLRLWNALLEAGADFAVAPYGLDALNTLRIEKGHVTGAELNGNTTRSGSRLRAHAEKERRFHRPRARAARGARGADTRLQLVGVRPSARTARLRNGLQLTAGDSRVSLGYVTSSTPSTELPGGWGWRCCPAGVPASASGCVAHSPVHGEEIEVEIVNPHACSTRRTRVSVPEERSDVRRAGVRLRTCALDITELAAFAGRTPDLRERAAGRGIQLPRLGQDRAHGRRPGAQRASRALAAPEHAGRARQRAGPLAGALRQHGRGASITAAH